MIRLSPQHFFKRTPRSLVSGQYFLNTLSIKRSPLKRGRLIENYLKKVSAYLKLLSSYRRENKNKFLLCSEHPFYIL